MWASLEPSCGRADRRGLRLLEEQTAAARSVRRLPWFASYLRLPNGKA